MSLALLLLQLTVILVTARLCGLLLRTMGQPMVIGEMAAGIVLGPIVLGQLAPQWQAALFPADSRMALSSLAQVGVILFMFIVGAELRAPRGTGATLRAAALVALASLLLPLALGLAIAPWLYASLAPAGVAFWPFALFVGVALSITAFPVLARILKDRRLTHSRIGQLGLGAAGLLDALAWLLLALVVALGSASGVHASAEGAAGQAAAFVLLRMVGGALVLVALLFFVVRPLLARWLHRHAQPEALSTQWLALLLMGALACAWVTEWLHLHAVFGAFLFGLALPRDARLVQALVDRLEPLSLVLLMPIFFALAGLGASTSAWGAAGWGWFLLILGVACAGKVVGGALGARVAGYSWPESWATGALMNTRGLMELIVIQVGLDVGLIGAPMFTLLLLMALLTTALTGPLLSLIGWQHPAALAQPLADTEASTVAPRSAG